MDLARGARRARRSLRGDLVRNGREHRRRPRLDRATRRSLARDAQLGGGAGRRDRAASLLRRLVGPGVAPPRPRGARISAHPALPSNADRPEQADSCPGMAGRDRVPNLPPRRRADVLRRLRRELQGLVGVDRGVVRDVGPLAPGRAVVRAGPLAPRSRGRRADRRRDLPSPRDGRGSRLGADSRRPPPVAEARARAGAPARGVRGLPRARVRARGARRGRRERHRREPALRASRHACERAVRRLREGAHMSSLRARCSDVGAVRGLAARSDRLAVVWLDAHGDLNTPETSPSGNAWGMPLRMLLDDGVVRPEDVALVGARNLDPPEVEYLAATGIDDSLERALEQADAVYVALDLDVLEPSEAAMFMPEPNGPTVRELEAVLRDVVSRTRLAGMGVTGHLAEERNVLVVTRLLTAAG